MAVIDNYQHTFDPDRGGIPWHGAYGTDFVLACWAEFLSSNGIGQLGFVDLHIPARDGEHQAVDSFFTLLNAGDDKHCLGGFRFRDAEKICQRFNRFRSWGGDFFDWLSILSG
jgi:hypothetical protein